MRKTIRYLILACLYLLPCFAFGQLQSVQYWFDANFAGRKTQTASSRSVQLTELNASELSEGIHQLHIRAKDNNNWSVVHSQMFYKLPGSASGIEMATYEYWIDSDFENKKSGTLSGTLATITELNVSSYNEGMHVLNIRVKDKLGRYSVVHSQMFYKFPETTTIGMTSYEYWVDDDIAGKKTGTLSGKTITINDLNVDSYDEGIHILHIRAQDAVGRYSVVHSQMFYKLAGSATNNEVAQYEYWIDNDFDKRKKVTASGKVFALAEGLDLQNISGGLHTIFMRAKDKQNRWSVVHSQSFYVNASSPDGTNKIDAYRYWYDNDFDSHNFVELEETVNPYELKENRVLPVEFKLGESHTFHIQFRDLAGKWSNVATETFTVVPLFSEDEFAALKVFYKSTNGDKWLNTQNNDAPWDTLSIATVSDWKGLLTSEGKVAAIELPGNNLTGIVPAEICAKLPNLKTLNLENNSIETLSDALPKALSLNIKYQHFDRGTIEVSAEENLIVPLSGISRYSHSNGNFSANNRFDLNINEVYKTRITSSNGTVSVAKSYFSGIKKGDVITLVQNNGDAVGTTYKYVVDGIVVNVSAIALNKTNATLTVGESETLTYTITPENATNQNVIWESSDENIAIVENGVVTAIGVGEASVTVKTEDGGKTAKCTVTVDPNPVSGISLNKEKTTILVGKTETLTYIIQPINASNQNVTWSSSDTNVATIDAGVITGIGVGTVTISVTTEDGNKTAECVVDVESESVPVVSVTMDKTETTLLIGESELLTYTITPANATNQNVTWESSDENVVTVVNGIIKAIGVGTTVVSITTDDGNETASCTVVVPPVEITDIFLNKNNVSLLVGESETLIYTITPSNATNQPVIWESSDTGIAIVVDGVVEAVGAGSAIITVKTLDGDKMASCIIAVSPIEVTSIVLNKDNTTLLIGESETLTYLIMPENASNKNVVWISSDESVVTVVDGVVTGIQVGSSVVTVQTEDNKFADSCLVTVIGETSVKELRKNDIRVYPNPVKDGFFVKGAENALLKIYDMNGNLVLQQQIDEQGYIKIDSFASGTYIVKIYITDEIIEYKIIKT